MPGRLSPSRKPGPFLALALGCLAVLAAGASLGLQGSGLPRFGRRAVRSAPASARVAALGRPLSFEENRGQAAARTRFLSRGPGYTLALSPTEAVVSLAGRQAVERSRSAAAGSPQHSTLNTQHSLRLRLVGGSTRAKVTGIEKQRGIVNYLIGNDPKQWRTHIPTFAKVKYERVYPGVDLVYHGTQGSLEYDFEVAPGADPSQIRLSATGAEKVELSPTGDLLLHTPAGTLTQHKPVAYQQIDGRRVEVAARFTLDPSSVIRHPSPNHARFRDASRITDDASQSAIRNPQSAIVSFQLARYDATQPLIIDPTLAFSTYFGGSSDDTGTGVATDSSGSVYVCGYTTSTDLATAGPYQGAAGGGTDAFLFKLSADGSTLHYATYLGGSANEFGLDVDVDGSGQACAVGYTRSTNFPTGNAYDTTGDSNADAFVTRLSADGASLIYSTYLGATGFDSCTDVEVEADGVAHLVGVAASSGFPMVAAVDTTFSGGSEAWVAEFPADGSAPSYSTFLGGTGAEQGFAIAVDSDGSAYVTGETGSATTFPVVNAIYSTRAGSTGNDAFVSKLTWNGTTLALAYSTYLGGSANERGLGIAVDSSGAAYTTGYTGSSDFPTTSGAYDTSFGSSSDIYVTGLTAAGTALAYSTYLGNSGDKHGNRIAVDTDGQAVVVGYTTGAYPTTNAYQATYGGSQDGVITKLAADGASLVYSTYLGGTGSDNVAAVALTSDGNAVLAGSTSSSSFPLVNAVDSSLASSEAFAARLVTFAAPSGFTVTEGSNGRPSLSWTDNSVEESGYYAFRIDNDDNGANLNFAADSTSHEDTTATVGKIQHYSLRAYTATRTTTFAQATFTPTTPTAPSGLTATLNTEGTVVSLSWTDNSNNELTFRVERSTDGGATWETLTTLAAGSTSTADTDISGRSVIHYRVTAVNEGGENTSAEVARYIVPTDLTVIEGANGKPVLSWTDGFADETGYSIERQTVSTLSGFTEVLATSANETTSIEDTTATVGVAYEYRVRAIRVGYSGYSATALFVPPAPEAPSDLSAQTSVSGTSVTLTWTDNSDNETQVVIWRTSDGGATFDPILVRTPPVTTATDSSADPNATYYYQVIAYNDGGGGASPIVEASPRQPDGLTAEAVSGSAVELAWTDNSWNEEGFELERKAGSGSYMLLADLPPGTRSHRHTGLAENTTYTYRLRSYCESASGWAGPVSATTFTSTPEAPGSLKVYSPDRGSVVLTWVDNSADESGFKVYRRLGSTGAYGLLASVAANANTYTDATTTGDTKYSYAVSAFNDRGVSPSTKEQSVTTLWGPESLAASAVTTAQIDLSWKDLSLYEDGYSIERKKGSGSYYEVGRADGKVGKNQTLTYSDTGLTSGVSYTYRVRAYNTNATSLYATGTSITTTSAPAPGLRVTPVQKSFGRVPKGQARTATFQVKNAGKKQEEVTLSALAGAFQVLGSRRFTLTAGASRTFKVRFGARTLGLYTIELPVKCQHGEVVKIKLEGRSVRG
jgi:hypothetical protein